MGPPQNSRVIGPPRKADVRLPGKGNSNSHGARPVHLIIMMIKWIRTSRLSMKNSLSLSLWEIGPPQNARAIGPPLDTWEVRPPQDWRDIA